MRLQDFQLYLFDFDGLLVNTEELHFAAYIEMCKARSHNLDWDFATYCQSAHYSAEALKENIYKQIPALYAEEPHWSVLYAEKKEAFLRLVREGSVQFMPGAKELLTTLIEADIPSCVVTNSIREFIDEIAEQLPLLHRVTHFVTRESYQHPKPHSECYLTAIQSFSNPGDHIIGFEDTPRGLQALLGTPATPILVSQIPYPEIPAFQAKGVRHLTSLKDI